MNIAENISHNIAKFKGVLKIKNYDLLAQEVFMNGQKVRRIKRMEQSPKINEIEAFANYFGVNPIDFMTKKF